MQIKRNGWGARGGLFENLEFDGLQIGTLMFFRQFSVFFRPEPVVPAQIGLLVRANGRRRARAGTTSQPIRPQTVGGRLQTVGWSAAVLTDGQWICRRAHKRSVGACSWSVIWLICPQTVSGCLQTDSSSEMFPVHCFFNQEKKKQIQCFFLCLRKKWKNSN